MDTATSKALALSYADLATQCRTEAARCRSLASQFAEQGRGELAAKWEEFAAQWDVDALLWSSL